MLWPEVLLLHSNLLRIPETELQAVLLRAALSLPEGIAVKHRRLAHPDQRDLKLPVSPEAQGEQAKTLPAHLQQELTFPNPKWRSIPNWAETKVDTCSAKEVLSLTARKDIWLAVLKTENLAITRALRRTDFQQWVIS